MTNMRVLHECKDSHDHDFANCIQHRRNNSKNHLQTTTELEINAMDDEDECASIIHHLNMIESCFSE